MPRYVVERTFPEGLEIPAGDDGVELCTSVVDRNAESGVTWVHSYVSADKAKTFCVYDAPTPEAIRRTAARNDLPIERITEVRVLDPYFYMHSQSFGQENRLGLRDQRVENPGTFCNPNPTPLPPQPDRNK